MGKRSPIRGTVLWFESGGEWLDLPKRLVGLIFLKDSINPKDYGWFRGVMVSTLDFESNDPGSNPGETLGISHFIV